MINDIVKQTIGCYYTWERACVLEGGVDSDRNLYILNFDECFFTTVSSMGEKLRLKYKYGNIYINRHPALKYAYGFGVTEIDFEGNEKGDYQSISDTFNSLYSEKKIITDLDVKKLHIRNSLDLVIIGLLQELSGYDPTAWYR